VAPPAETAATTAAPDVPVKGAYEYLLTQGVLGVMSVLLIVALIWSVKNLLKAKDDRVSDQGKYADALKSINEAVRDLTVEMNKSATSTANEVLRSNEVLKISMATLEKSHEKLARDIDTLRDEQVRLGAGLSSSARR
jgi:hypothetical protein